MRLSLVSKIGFTSPPRRTGKLRATGKKRAPGRVRGWADEQVGFVKKPTIAVDSQGTAKVIAPVSEGGYAVGLRATDVSPGTVRGNVRPSPLAGRPMPGVDFGPGRYQAKFGKADKERKRDTRAERIAGGSALIAAGHGAREASLIRNKVPAGITHQVKDVARGGVKGRHLKHGAVVIGTRGMMAGGAALGVSGLSRRKRSDEVDARNVARDVVDRTVAKPRSPNLEGVTLDGSKENRARAAALAGGILGGAIGGTAGRHLALGHLKGLKGHRMASAMVGGTAGTIGGAALSVPAARKMVREVTDDEYTYQRGKGVRAMPNKSPVAKMASSDAAILELKRNEQKDLIARKRKQRAFSLTSAGLGATALGLRAPQLVSAVGGKVAPKARAVERARAMTPKATNWSNNVGVGSIGVGSLGSLNFARIQAAESKAEQKAVDRSKVGKALPRIRLSSVPRPKKPSTVRTGGFYMRPDGVTGYRRGSL